MNSTKPSAAQEIRFRPQRTDRLISCHEVPPEGHKLKTAIVKEQYQYDLLIVGRALIEAHLRGE